MELLDFVSTHYDHILENSELGFRADFERLSFAAQCLYVRLANRRGRLFKTNTLRYPEITDLGSALRELETAGFVQPASPSHTEEILGLLTRAQLISALKSLSIPVPSSLKKPEILQLALEHIPPYRLITLIPLNNIVAQARYEELRFVLFLFFGQLQDGMSQFAMRDLGLVRALDPEGSYEPRFADRGEAEQAFSLACHLQQLQKDQRFALHLAHNAALWPEPQAPIVADLRDELALATGKLLEGDTELALSVYQRGESVQCSERIIRLLLTSGRRDEAKRYLERCIESPSSGDEALLAKDIYERKFKQKKTSALTDLLRKAPYIELDDAYRGSPEWAAVMYFEKRGKRAFRTENRFWRTLFGLLFWDLIFETQGSSPCSPFERLPAALLERRFLAEHADAIEQRLALLTKPKAVQQFLLRICAANFGKANGLFRWRQGTLSAIQAFIELAPAEATAQILRLFCADYPAAKHGYPDLLVIDGEDLIFTEIKTDGDQLRRNQMHRLQQLQQAGFQADINRVQWVIDPTQAYVVVDVETTGGKGRHHRITEIGAVKVVGDGVVDSFKTLINPERPIPAGITRLTGITNEMVESAPVFSEIADAFAAFTEDAIFVAHNVEFDYGFIHSEFERLDRRYRRPKLCTCASMRKLYPGQQSYALASLCAAYDIPLRSHHRALCDAEAAAQLLLLINEKRSEQLRKTD